MRGAGLRSPNIRVHFLKSLETKLGCHTTAYKIHAVKTHQENLGLCFPRPKRNSPDRRFSSREVKKSVTEDETRVSHYTPESKIHAVETHQENLGLCFPVPKRNYPDRCFASREVKKKAVTDLMRPGWIAEMEPSGPHPATSVPVPSRVVVRGWSIVTGYTPASPIEARQRERLPHNCSNWKATDRLTLRTRRPVQFRRRYAICMYPTRELAPFHSAYNNFAEAIGTLVGKPPIGDASVSSAYEVSANRRLQRSYDTNGSAEPVRTNELKARDDRPWVVIRKCRLWCSSPALSRVSVEHRQAKVRHGPSCTVIPHRDRGRALMPILAEISDYRSDLFFPTVVGRYVG
ncbi:hypothetical protein AAG570_006135 [Ranatra chinensis]|uniref:Uncharacterized protein n=1 Tax=Ranatra chinensis TaxID=642074 RepID=A0ABD0XX60_9HEMI